MKNWHSVKVMRCAKLHMTFIHASKQYQVCNSIVSDDEVMYLHNRDQWNVFYHYQLMMH